MSGGGGVSGEDSGPTKCVICFAAAELYCGECTENMCMPCAKKIHAMKKFRGHSASFTMVKRSHASNPDTADDEDMLETLRGLTPSPSMSIDSKPRNQEEEASIIYCAMKECSEIARFHCEQCMPTKKGGPLRLCVRHERTVHLAENHHRPKFIPNNTPRRQRPSSKAGGRASAPPTVFTPLSAMIKKRDPAGGTEPEEVRKGRFSEVPPAPDSPPLMLQRFLFASETDAPSGDDRPGRWACSSPFGNQEETAAERGLDCLLRRKANLASPSTSPALHRAGRSSRKRRAETSPMDVKSEAKSFWVKMCSGSSRESFK